MKEQNHALLCTTLLMAISWPCESCLTSLYFGRSALGVLFASVPIKSIRCIGMQVSSFEGCFPIINNVLIKIYVHVSFLFLGMIFEITESNNMSLDRSLQTFLYAF